MQSVIRARRAAQEVYDDILYNLKQWGSIGMNALIREYEDKFPDLNFKKIWPYVEALRKKDKKIFLYTDTYNGITQEFWLYSPQ